MDTEIRQRKPSQEARAMIDAVKASPDPKNDTALAHWKDRFPKLFAMVCDPRHSEVMLNAMLRQLEAGEVGSRSTHDASVVVGTVLVNEYVRPKLGMDPTPLPDSVLR